jgi:TM2 domain-containing membrane protein YozV
MNCVNHPENPVAAYCQNCGKALCSSCVRAVSGVIYCEQCLAARLGIGGAAGPGSGPGAVPGSGPGAGPYPGVIAPAGPNPGTAFALGFIPGVGAMYNGQFVKGLMHVLVFVILVGITENHGIFGIFVAAWVVYQVFDAYETAKARRDGLPLPDPFGLNELGAKLGIPNPLGGPTSRGFTAQTPPVPPPPGAGFPPAAGFTPATGFTDPYVQPPYTAVPPVPPPPGFDPGLPPRRRHEPVGAMILIGLGVLFLLNTLNIFNFDWLGRLWPLLIIAFGALLFIRHSRETPPNPPPPPAGGPR